MTPAANRLSARVEHWQRDAPTQRITLRADGANFSAGQYLQLVHPDGERIPFSIASSPLRLPLIDLHYRPTPGHVHTALMDTLSRAGTIEIELPFGNVVTRADASRPLVCLAQETGMSQVMSILTDLAGRNSQRQRWVAWVCPSGDFYCRHELDELGAEVQTAAADDAMHLLPSAPLTNSEIVLCGSPDWVYRHVDHLLAAGVAPSQLRSDAFAYAPRPPTTS